MILRFVLLVVAVSAQIPQQPAVTTSSACLNGCLQDGSLVFAASNLRNFEKILINIDQFCNTHEQLVKCASQCSEEDRVDLIRRISLSEYICKDKVEEFRLSRDCVQSQQTESVNDCATECGHPQNANIQLDSSPSAAVNPFAFFDSISPVCRTIECIVKCSISESNKKCAGSGDIFRDIGFKQVVDASERLRNDVDNSSSPVAGQLAKIYLEGLPEQCSYFVDPAKYLMLFTERGDEVGSEMVTQTASIEEFTTIAIREDQQEQTTTTEFPRNADEVALNIEPSASTEKPGESHDPFEKQKAVPSQSDVEHVPEEDDSLITTSTATLRETQQQTSMKASSTLTVPQTTASHKGEVVVATSVEPNSGEQATTAESVASDVERTIVVVNDDTEINNNEVHAEKHEAQQQKANDATRSAFALLLIAVALLVNQP